MATSLIFMICFMFGMTQVLVARRSRRYSRMLDRDDFLFQRRQVAKGVRRSASVMVGLGLLFSIVPLFLALYSQAKAAPGSVHARSDGQQTMRLATALSCVPSSPSDGVCSNPD